MLTTQLTGRGQRVEPDAQVARQRLGALRAATGRGPVAPSPAGRPRPVRPVAVETTVPLPVVGLVSGQRWDRLLSRWVPASWLAARLDPGRRGALALIVVAALAAVVAAAGVWRDRPVAELVPPQPAAVGPAVPLRSGVVGSSTPGQPVAHSGPLVVSVVGKVRRPGLVRIPEDARVADAIDTAGGPLPRADLTGLNLARRVADGEQIVVGLPAPPEGAPSTAVPGPAAGGTTAAPGGKIDLNRATLQQLDTLPGVGPVTAQRILDWRAQHGRFTAVEQLREVEGIGERRFGQLRDQVTV